MGAPKRKSNEHNRQHGRVINQIDDRIGAESIQHREHELTQLKGGRFGKNFSHALVVWRQFIAQAAKATCATVRCVLTQLTHLMDECVDLLLLLKDGLVELLYQVFGEAGFDLELHQAFVNVGVGHMCVLFVGLVDFSQLSSQAF